VPKYRTSAERFSNRLAVHRVSKTAFVEGENASAAPLFGIAMTVLSLALFRLLLISVRRRGTA
jgi:hypothetical protein